MFLPFSDKGIKNCRVETCKQKDKAEVEILISDKLGQGKKTKRKTRIFYNSKGHVTIGNEDKLVTNFYITNIVGTAFRKSEIQDIQCKIDKTF